MDQGDIPAASSDSRLTMKIAADVLETIGMTSLVKLRRIVPDGSDGLLDRQARGACADRMILECDGRAEERHYPVALDPVHDALVRVNGIDKGCQDGFEAHGRFFRIEAVDERRGLANVREEDGDLLELVAAFVAREQDLPD